MHTDTSTIQYFAYLRKSSEGDERQALSIDSQRDKVREMFPHLTIVDVLVEKHSAFKPYARPVFEDMIRRIKRGEATGIIAWHPDRLSRNEIDASTVTYLVRTGVIADLKFGSYNFDNSPEGIMMLQLALSQSQYFSSKLGKDVKRGLQKKFEMGWMPGVAPEGYKNNSDQEKGFRTISVDTPRFKLLRKAFDLLLTGAHSAEEVRRILNDEWGYKTRKRRRSGNRPMARTTWYTLLSNPFYAGIIQYNGKEKVGKHKPMITMHEFNRVQELLGRKNLKRQSKRRDLTYTGLFRCDHCDCAITAEVKTKYIKSKKKVKEYTYYHCTHKNKDIPCKQGSMSEAQIEKSVDEVLKSLEIHPILLDWALDYLDTQNGQEKDTQKQIEASVKKEVAELKEQISGLTLMRARNLLDDTEFMREKKTLEKKVLTLERSLLEREQVDTVALTRETFIFAAHARKKFANGSKRDKREVITTLGSNRRIFDKKLHITAKKSFQTIQDVLPSFHRRLDRIEPTKFGLNYMKKDPLKGLNSDWLERRDSNPRPIG